MTATIPTSEHGNREATASERFASLPPEVVNALLEQRDDIVSAVGRANDLDELRAARKLVDLVGVLWSRLGHGYKVAEVNARIKSQAERLARQMREVVSVRRVGTKNYGLAFQAAEALEAFAVEF